MSPRPSEAARAEAAGAWCLRLAEGSLTVHEQQAFEAWLADPRNHQAFEDSVGVWRAVGEDSTSPTLLALRRDALADFERASRRLWSGRLGTRWPALAALAASLILVLAAGWLWSGLTSAVYRTDLGERRVVRLSDGSKLSLDAATEVSVRYSGRARRLWLKAGRAKFEVTHDPVRPFTVAAADKLVRATGTAFSVELLRGVVRVVLYEGRVSVTGGPGAARPLRVRPGPGAVDAPAEAILAPGHELVAPIDVVVAQVAPVDPVRSLTWEAGQLSFEGEPLAVAVERMNRYSPEKLSVGDAGAAAVRIDGVFDAGDSEAFVEGVTGVFPVRAEPTGDGVRFVSGR